MKTLNFKNIDMVPIANFLGNLTLKNKASRGRSKLIKMLSEKNDERNVEIQEVIDKYAEKDEEGKQVSNEQGNVQWAEGQAEEALAQITDINNEMVGIDYTEYSEKMKNLHTGLEDSDEGISNSEAVIYDLLMDQLENDEKTESEGK